MTSTITLTLRGKAYCNSCDFDKRTLPALDVANARFEPIPHAALQIIDDEDCHIVDEHDVNCTDRADRFIRWNASPHILMISPPVVSIAFAIISCETKADPAIIGICATKT
jgi:hypothetical protein